MNIYGYEFDLISVTIENGSRYMNHCLIFSLKDEHGKDISIIPADLSLFSLRGQTATLNALNWYEQQNDIENYHKVLKEIERIQFIDCLFLSVGDLLNTSRKYTAYMFGKLSSTGKVI